MHKSAGTKDKNVYISEHPITEIVRQKLQGSYNKLNISVQMFKMYI